jgi:preprotein translocase subunit SecE
MFSPAATLTKTFSMNLRKLLFLQTPAPSPQAQFAKNFAKELKKKEFPNRKKFAK